MILNVTINRQWWLQQWQLCGQICVRYISDWKQQITNISGV